MPSEFPRLLLTGASLAPLAGAVGGRQAPLGHSSRLHWGALAGALPAAAAAQQDFLSSRTVIWLSFMAYTCFKETKGKKEKKKKLTALFLD